MIEDFRNLFTGWNQTHGCVTSDRPQLIL